jgi:hypothetical protein
MKHLKLFEEFNPYTGKQFADKLKIYAEASIVTKSVSPYELNGNMIIFDIYTSIPGDYNTGNKIFKVSIPVDTVSKSYVDTYESGKKVLRTSLEPGDENDINNILLNYIEACELYDDSSTENIVDAYKTVTGVEDIKKIIRNLG